MVFSAFVKIEPGVRKAIIRLCETMTEKPVPMAVGLERGLAALGVDP